jgi:hypothetical protein
MAAMLRLVRGALVALAIAAVAPGRPHGQPLPRSQQPPASTADGVCNIQTSERIVVIGDVHGAYDRFVAILRAAGVLDRRDRWVGGKTILIQTGDVLDRGADSRRSVDLLRRLERDAPRDGGRVLALLGNHEFMRIVGDWRYVSPGELRAFRTADSEELRERVHATAAEEAARRALQEKRLFNRADYRRKFMEDVPAGYIEMRLAFDAGGEYGRWVRERPTVVKVNGILFMHAGISEKMAPLGCAGINAAVSKEMASLPIPADQVPALLSSTEDGPLWYRGMATEPEDTFAPTLAAILSRLNARAIVIGHTPILKGRITQRFGGRVLTIDTGMLNGEFFPGGVASALEIQGDAFTAIYEARREPLTRPATASN